MEPILFKGQTFSSFDEVKETIKQYEETNYVTISMKHSRKLGTRIGNRLPLKNPNTALVYSGRLNMILSLRNYDPISNINTLG